MDEFSAVVLYASACGRYEAKKFIGAGQRVYIVFPLILAPSLIEAPPSYWDQENILCLELKFTKSTNFHLNTTILLSIYQ